jgi:hypothetical protein
MSITADLSAGAGGVAAGVGAVTGAVSAVAGAAVGVVDAIASFIPAMLVCVTPPNLGVVPFDYNPEKIVMARSSTTRSTPRLTGATGNLPGTNTAGGQRSPTQTVTGSKITLNPVILEGPLTKLRCDTLLTWMNPQSGFLAIAALKKNLSAEPAKLTFSWGPPMIGFMYDCKITSCTVTYTRFSGAGIPLRAELNIQLDEIPSLLGSLPTNPTSGGLAGRRSHMVAQGESLQSISTQNYGTPALWRRIAEVNRIQNPMRVQPGTAIYLPNPEELTSRSGS